HGKSGNEDRAVDADLVHCRHHLVTRHVIRPVRHTVPGPFRRVRLVDVDLGIDDRHRARSSPLSGVVVLEQFATAMSRSASAVRSRSRLTTPGRLVLRGSTAHYEKFKHLFSERRYIASAPSPSSTAELSPEFRSSS